MASIICTNVKWPGGERAFYFRKGSSDGAVIGQMLLDTDYELRRLKRWPEIAEFLDAHANRGDRPFIIDAGANIGASSLYFALHVPRSQMGVELAKEKARRSGAECNFSWTRPIRPVPDRPTQLAVAKTIPKSTAQ